MPNVSVERINSDGLSRVVWGFWIDWKYSSEVDVVFDTYVEEERRTKRHKWETKRMWARLGLHHASPLQKLPMPELPEDIKKEVVENIVKTIRIVLPPKK
jgi:hypothetical protein